MRRILYPGTFDPITLGHEDIVKRALKLFDGLILAVARSESKKPIFTQEERMEMARDVFGPHGSVEVVSFSGLTYKFAEQMQVTTILRGVRTTTDFEFELQLASMNRSLKKDLETVFLTPDIGFSHISSTLVREIAQYGGDTSHLVPDKVRRKLEQKLAS